MSSPKSITLNLTDKEMSIVESLCKKKDLSKTALLKQSLRLYQHIEERLEKGDRLFINKNELLILGK